MLYKVVLTIKPVDKILKHESVDEILKSGHSTESYKVHAVPPSCIFTHLPQYDI